MEHMITFILGAMVGAVIALFMVAVHSGEND